jgi:hypothetical protein
MLISNIDMCITIDRDVRWHVHSHWQGCSLTCV